MARFKMNMRKQIAWIQVELPISKRDRAIHVYFVRFLFLLFSFFFNIHAFFYHFNMRSFPTTSSISITLWKMHQKHVTMMICVCTDAYNVTDSKKIVLPAVFKAKKWRNRCIVVVFVVGCFVCFSLSIILSFSKCLIVMNSCVVIVMVLHDYDYNSMFKSWQSAISHQNRK